MPFRYADKPFRYLGILFDSRLTFTAHVARFKKQVGTAFGIIHRELRHCWHVNAGTIWNIYDMCVFAIYKYSAFLWPTLSAELRNNLTLHYRKIFRSIFGCPSDTGMYYLYLQTNTYDLPIIMEQEVSIHLTRGLRSPANSALSVLFGNKYDEPDEPDFVPANYQDDGRNTTISKMI